jgi:hypothetical protein
MLEIPSVEQWTECSSSPMDCLDEAEPDVVKSSYGGRRRLCGLMSIVVAEPTPWAWANLAVSPESKVRLVEAKC